MFVVESGNIEDEKPDAGKQHERTGMCSEAFIRREFQISEEQRHVERDDEAGDVASDEYE